MSQVLLESFNIKARKNFIPLFSTIEITHDCNLKCRHCYNFDRTRHSKSPQVSTLSTEEIKKAMDQLAHAGALYLNLTGGEPLRHPDILELVSHAKKRHFYVRIKSNGTLLTQKKAHDLYQAGLDAIDISLYGSSEDSYKEFTQTLTFDKAIAGIKAAHNAKLEVDLSLIIHRYNIFELEEMVTLCQSNDWSFQVSDEITDRYDKSSARQSYSLTKDQYHELLQGPFREIFAFNNSDRALQCSCAKSVCAIALNGDVYPCIGSPIKSGNIRDQDFASIWKESDVFNRIRHLKDKDFKDCTSCSYIESCSRSSGSALINTGKYTACDPFALMRAKVRDFDKKSLAKS